jgi:hypothetical protein
MNLEQGSAQPGVKLSPTMEHAVTLAQSNGGKLMRHPGGYWSTPAFDNMTHAGRQVPTFSTNTAHALVTRGVAKWSEWNYSGSVRFPVELTLVPSNDGSATR